MYLRIQCEVSILSIPTIGTVSSLPVRISRSSGIALRMLAVAANSLFQVITKPEQILAKCPF